MLRQMPCFVPPPVPVSQDKKQATGQILCRKAIQTLIILFIIAAILRWIRQRFRTENGCVTLADARRESKRTRKNLVRRQLERGKKNLPLKFLLWPLRSLIPENLNCRENYVCQLPSLERTRWKPPLEKEESSLEPLATMANVVLAIVRLIE